jgi:hypothetical protein
MNFQFRGRVICLLFLLTFTYFTGNVKASTKTAQTPKNKVVSRFSFENDFGLIFLKVQVNQSKPLWFLLDTGFDVNILNARWVRPLNLELKDKQVVPQPGGAIEMGSVTGLSFKLPGLKLSNQSANSAPLSSLEPIIGRSLDGILGHDFLSQFVTEIDYIKKVITLYEPESYKYAGTGRTLPIEINNKEPFIKGKILQPRRTGIEGKFKVDTGSIDVMGLNKNFLEAAQVLVESQRTVDEPGVAVGGETKGICFRVTGLEFGGLRLSSSVIGATLDSGGFENRTDSGTIGAGLLQRFKLILDYPHRQIVLEKNSNFAAPFVHDTSGLRIIANGSNFKTFKVVNVLKSSPASAAGLRDGDIIISINNVPATGFTLSQVREILLKGNNKTYRLKVKRGDEELTILIKLKELI